MDFKQVIQFTEMKETNTTVFVSLLSNIQFNGYGYLTNNLEMNSHFMNDSASFISYYRQSIVSNKERRLFDYAYCVCQTRQISSPLSRSNSISAISGLSGSRVAGSPTKTNRELKEELPEGYIAQSDVKLVEEYFQDVNNDKFVDWVRSKGNESYYLKLRFDQTPK